jgi:hypothetical protein
MRSGRTAHIRGDLITPLPVTAPPPLARYRFSQENNSDREHSILSMPRNGWGELLETRQSKPSHNTWAAEQIRGLSNFEL